MEKSCHSKLMFLSSLRKIGALAAFILMLTALLLFICMMGSTHASLANLVSGKAFLIRFEYPSLPIQRWYFIATVYIAVALPYTVLARCLSHRKTRLAYWSFAIPTAALYLYLLMILTVPFSWLIQYIEAMGFTPKRIYGLFYGLGGYVVLLGFLWWALRKPGEIKGARGKVKVKGVRCMFGGRKKENHTRPEKSISLRPSRCPRLKQIPSTCARVFMPRVSCYSCCVALREVVSCLSRARSMQKHGLEER